MSEAHYCDRCEELFRGPSAVVIQSGRFEGELCPACVDEFEGWWELENEASEGETIGDQIGS